MRIWLILFCLITALPVAFPAPDQIEFVFLSRKQVAMLERLIDRLSTPYVFAAPTAQSFECIPMGDGCFHPQFGIVPDKSQDAKDAKDSEIKQVAAPTGVPEINIEKEEGDVKVGTFNALETDLVKCEEDQYFDIFCGKAKPIAKAAGMEIWVDVSASLREVDYSKDPTHCYRRSFLDKVQAQCPASKVDVSIFNTAKMQMGTLESACQSHGLNNAKKMIDWIEGSKARHLFVITDIDEYGFELRDYLSKVNAKTHGVGTKPMPAEELLKFAESIIQACQKS